MTSNHDRASILACALQAALDRDHDTLRALAVDDLRAWTPRAATSSLEELLAALAARDEAFSDIGLELAALDVGGDYACVEWTVAMTHSGPLRLDDGSVLAPSGERVVVHGVTVAEFLDDRICSLRQYWDELAVLDQLGLISPDD